MGGTEGGAVASNPSHQGAAQRKLSSNIDFAAASDVGQKEQGARLICRTANLWGSQGRRDGEEGGGETVRRGNRARVRFDVEQL